MNKKKYLVIFFMILILVFLFPYSGDDWAWGSSIGTSRLTSLFRDYNGRYMGNLIVLLLTRNRIIRSLFVSFTIVGIAYLCEKIIDNHNKAKINLFVISLVLLLLMPSDMMRQTIVWTSGYSNYLLSIFLTLIYINYCHGYKVDNSKFKIFLFLILGFINSLFIEHITIFNILYSLYNIIVSLWKKEKVNMIDLAYLFGSFLGAILMFSNGAYLNVVNGTDNYRNTANSISSLLYKVKDNYFKEIYKLLISNNIVLQSLLVLLLVIYVIKEKSYINKKKIFYIPFVINIVYIIYIIFKWLNPTWNILLKYTIYFEGFFTFLYCISLVLTTLFFIDNKELKRRLLLYLLYIFLADFSLFMVSPIGSRCFVASYVFFMLYVLDMISQFSINNRVIINKLLLVIFSVILIFYFNIYGYIFMVDYERLEDIKRNTNDGNKTIIVRKLPYEEYVWFGDPIPDTEWNTRFKLFYKIGDDVIIILED